MKDRAGARSAKCGTCGKDFARSDTLLRHEKSHHTTEDRGPVHRVTNGTFRACSTCAAARSRCSGGLPCGRCSVRKVDCKYPNKRRKGAPDGQVLTFDDSPTPPAANLSKDMHFIANNQIHFAPTYSPSQPSISNPGDAPASGQAPAQQHSFAEQSLQRDGIRSEPMHQSLGAAVQAPVSMPHQPFHTPIDPNQSYPGSSLSGQFQTEFNPGPYDYSSFEEPMNWIPISVYPSPYENEFEHDISFLFPPLPDSTSIGLDYNTSIPYDTSTQLYKPAEPIPQLEAGDQDAHTFPGTLTGLAYSPTSSASNEHPATKSTSSSTGTGEKRKRRKSSHAPDPFSKPKQNSAGFSFPDFHLPGPNALSRCSPATYDTIVDNFRRLCLKADSLRPFESPRFPDIGTLGACLDLYFENFNPSFPLLHRPTFTNQASWLEMVAAATIGSTFAKITSVVEVRDAFQEFLRRAIHHYTDGRVDSSLDLALARGRILHLVGTAQSDRDQVRSLAPRYHADLSRWCLESGILQLSDRASINSEASLMETSQYEWEKWIGVESIRRVGYLCWLLDTSFGYLANCRPLCNMDDARIPLPCSAEIWNAHDSEAWKLCYKNTETPPSLCEAIEYMYAKKAVDPRLSDLSQVLLINALFQRTWEVGTHIKQPLSEWVPTGKARGFLNTPSKDSFWLPLYPLYANWRNSACDCLDVIQWQAASIVAKASGVEHDLMLHLHLARLILLTPFQEIQDLLFSLIGRVEDASRASFYVHDGSYQPRNLAKLPQIRKITWRWLREDQHKARLAIVHAGSVFWHVRRYSSSSLYEPLAVYLASMVLWTYGSYKSAALERDAAANSNPKPVGGPSGPDSDLSIVQPSRFERKVSRLTLKNGHQPQSDVDKPASPTSPPNQFHNSPTALSTPASDSASSSESEDQMPQFIHLDRPCDDEMIQHFVRNGHNMSGHMANVGDICKTPNKVLVEGAKLLRTRLSCWGVSREYHDILMSLVAVAGKKGAGGNGV